MRGIKPSKLAKGEMTMRIGNVEIENPVFLAPMAGVTDLPYRILVKEMGCGLLYTEMISAKGLYYDNEKTTKLLDIDKKEQPISLQIFGSQPEIMAEIAEQLNDMSFQILDINMGCPTPKITKNGDGSALMKKPKLAGEIIKAVVKTSKKPVTIKIRKGWDDNLINAVEMAIKAQEAGAKAIAIHGRTREQYYSGQADWDIIREVKKEVTIPVIGNGDIYSPESAKHMMEYTGCDAIMIGRAAQGNPWIFKRIIHYLKTEELLPLPSTKEIVAMIIKHMEMLVQYKGEKLAIREMRKHIAWYTKGLKNATILRRETNKLESQRQVTALLTDYLYHNL